MLFVEKTCSVQSYDISIFKHFSAILFNSSIDTKMFPGISRTSNTISNSSTMKGWLESTGLDDLLLFTWPCLCGEEEQKGQGGANTGVGRSKRVIKAGTTVDGTPLLLQETSLGLFGIGLAPLLGGSNRYLIHISDYSSNA